MPAATLGSLGSLREPAIQHGRLAGSEEQGGWYGVLALALGRCPELEVELTRFRPARDVS